MQYEIAIKVFQNILSTYLITVWHWAMEQICSRAVLGLYICSAFQPHHSPHLFPKTCEGSILPSSVTWEMAREPPTKAQGYQQDEELGQLAPPLEDTCAGADVCTGGACFGCFSHSFCNFMDCSRPGSSVHRILQARILEWVAMPSSREPSWPRDQTCVSCIGRWILYHWGTSEAQWRDWRSRNHLEWLQKVTAGRKAVAGQLELEKTQSCSAETLTLSSITTRQLPSLLFGETTWREVTLPVQVSFRWVYDFVLKPPSTRSGHWGSIWCRDYFMTMQSVSSHRAPCWVWCFAVIILKFMMILKKGPHVLTQHGTPQIR